MNVRTVLLISLVCFVIISAGCISDDDDEKKDHDKGTEDRLPDDSGLDDGEGNGTIEPITYTDDMLGMTINMSKDTYVVDEEVEWELCIRNAYHKNLTVNPFYCFGSYCILIDMPNGSQQFYSPNDTGGTCGPMSDEDLMVLEPNASIYRKGGGSSEGGFSTPLVGTYNVTARYFSGDPEETTIPYWNLTKEAHTTFSVIDVTPTQLSDHIDIISPKGGEYFIDTVVLSWVIDHAVVDDYILRISDGNHWVDVTIDYALLTTTNIDENINRYTYTVSTDILNEGGGHLLSIWSKSESITSDAPFHILREDRIIGGHTERVNEVRWSNGFDRVTSCSNDGHINITDARTGTILQSYHVLEDDPSQDDIYSLAWSPDDGTLAFGSCNGWLYLWDLDSDTVTKSPVRYNGAAYCMQYSPDGSKIAVGWANFERCVRILDSSTLKETLKYNADEIIEAIDWNSNGSSISFTTAASNFGEYPATVIIMDPVTGLITKEYDEFPIMTPEGWSNVIWDLDWSPDDSMIALGLNDNTTVILDLSENDTSKTVIGPHEGSIMSVSWNEEGDRVLSGIKGGMIMVHEVTGGMDQAPEYRELLRLQAHDCNVISVDWGEDDTTFVTGSGHALGICDNSAKIWKF